MNWHVARWFLTTPAPQRSEIRSQTPVRGMKMEDPRSSIENGGSILNPRSSIFDPRSALVAILAAVWLTGGCHSGQSKPQTANSVSGTVFLNGKAINYGSVAFYDANGLQRKSIILIDGSYSVHN